MAFSGLQVLKAWLSDSERLAEMGKRASALGRPGATLDIVRVIGSEFLSSSE